MFIVYLKLEFVRQIRGSMDGTRGLGHRRRYVQAEQSIEFQRLVDTPGDEIYLRNCSLFRAHSGPLPMRRDDCLSMTPRVKPI